MYVLGWSGKVHTEQSPSPMPAAPLSSLSPPHWASASPPIWDKLTLLPAWWVCSYFRSCFDVTSFKCYLLWRYSCLLSQQELYLLWVPVSLFLSLCCVFTNFSVLNLYKWIFKKDLRVGDIAQSVRCLVRKYVEPSSNPQYLHESGI